MPLTPPLTSPLSAPKGLLVTAHVMRAPRLEHLDEPFGFGVRSPRISWQSQGASEAWTQLSYEIEYTPEGGEARHHRVKGSDQILVPWPFEELRSRERGSIRVRICGPDGWSDFSPRCAFEVGLLEPDDWTAAFISPRDIGGMGEPAPQLSTSFTLEEPPVSARLYVSACGIYDMSINGARVGDIHFAPGWTSYGTRIRYQSYDVTGLLHQGGNDIDAILGNGWYRGYLGFVGQRAFYGPRLALIAQLEVELASGRTIRVETDSTWSARDSHIVSDDFYNGQILDLRRRELRPREEALARVEVRDDIRVELVAPENAPVRVVDRRVPHAVSSPSELRHVVDFGQNLVGVVSLGVKRGETDRTVVVRHSEVLGADGELDVRPLRTAKATDTYVIPAGQGTMLLEPRFTFHGFRYAEIQGVSAAEAARSEAVVFGSDLRATGWFECSDPLLNQLHSNIRWGMRGNFLEVPTDCPQRDERLGWTGDIQVFAPTAAFLMDTAGFLNSWLRDLAIDQLPDGTVPNVVPNVLDHEDIGVAAWADAACIVPWTQYQQFGDVSILERQFDSMVAWVERERELCGPSLIWSEGFQFGDWLDPSAPADDPFAAKVDKGLFATACFIRSLDVVAAAADVLGDFEKAIRYTNLAAEVRRAFDEEFVSASGEVVSDCQTAYSLALCWDLLDSTEKREGAGARLAQLVTDADFAVDTGFVGTAFVLDALCDSGNSELAVDMLLRTECPSWLYSVSMGATTVWERWDSLLPDGTVNPGEMTSFNHYALGAVGDWLHRRLAGLAPVRPGYKDVRIAPVVTSRLTRASARHLSPYGEIECGWSLVEGELTIHVSVPAGVRAIVELPWAEEPVVIQNSRRSWQHQWSLLGSVR